MICQECNQRPATLHFTKSINGGKTEFHLCEVCAKEKGEMFMINNQASGFSLNSLLAGLLNIEPGLQQPKKEQRPQEQVLQCSKCQMTFKQFIKIGRFGCAHCYSEFRGQLDPILKRLHSGNWSHRGKIPARAGGSIQLRRKIEDMKKELKELILQEEFEKAAVRRDEIRSLEKQLSSGREGD
ncbi:MULTISPECIES: UvrB/UvrC motif-containing protein [Bacillus]|uniref:UvrB/UvrC motif-containing protein n=1 Tax=Bacillus TaxID=1386 RepID=UPI001CD74E36|nr:MULTISPECIES: UvrB/UvrC motif-containing protein [Bacillus]MCA1037674.1 UvrB/UvrC motif-containing protein [Bacillus infantis]